jgi:hypothetical protein
MYDIRKPQLNLKLKRNYTAIETQCSIEAIPYRIRRQRCIKITIKESTIALHKRSIDTSSIGSITTTLAVLSFETCRTHLQVTRPQAGNDKFTLGRLYRVGILSSECYLSFLP